MKVAALDLGTNTFLCLLAEGSKTGIAKIHEDLVEVVRLGQGVDKYKIFHPYAISRATTCLTEFKKSIDEFRPDKILAVATSAARDVANADELFKIGRDLQIPIEIIEGKKEAEISFSGAVVGFDIKNKNIAVIDVGGGSTEIILGRDHQIQVSESLNVGGVRLTEKFLSRQPIQKEEADRLRKFLQGELREFKNKYDLTAIEKVFAVAGTPTTLAALKLLAEGAGADTVAKIDGVVLTEADLESWQSQFAATSVEEKKQRWNLAGRADIIYAGTTILLEMVREFGFKEITVSSKGVRYGVALHLLQS